MKTAQECAAFLRQYNAWRRNEDPAAPEQLTPKAIGEAIDAAIVKLEAAEILASKARFYCQFCTQNGRAELVRAIGDFESAE
jgi:hypothetical protein